MNKVLKEVLSKVYAESESGEISIHKTNFDTLLKEVNELDKTLTELDLRYCQLLSHSCLLAEDCKYFEYNSMVFYCTECDEAPVESYLDKDNFYKCKKCKHRLAVVKKDKYEINSENSLIHIQGKHFSKSEARVIQVAYHYNQ